MNINIPKLPWNPTDPKVDVNVHLNSNLDEIDRALSAQQGIGAIVSPDIGQEVIDYANKRLQVWNGTSWITPDDIESAWSNWFPFPIESSSGLPHPGENTLYRTNSLLHRVELTGWIDSLGGGFGANTTFYSGITNGIPVGFAPSTGQVIYNNGATHPIGTSMMSASYMTVSPNTASGYVQVSGRFMGGSDYSSSLLLDGMAWWY